MTGDSFSLQSHLRKINDLVGQHHHLDLMYSAMHRGYYGGDPTYNESCLRQDGSRPGYKFADYIQSKFLWQNEVMLEHLSKRTPRDKVENERVSVDLRLAFAAAGWNEIYERDSPARYDTSAPIAYRDEHLDAILDLLRGTPPAPQTNWRKFFEQKAAGPIQEMLRDPVAQAFDRYVEPDQQVLVYGSLIPLFECMALLREAKPSSVPALNVQYHSSRVRKLRPVELSGHRFEVVVASFAVARAGLGIFGEPIDPEGDKKTMALLRNVLSSGGRLLLTLPRGPAAVLYNATRCYDESKRASLLEGWSIVEECAPAAPYSLPLPSNVLLKEYEMSFQSLIVSPEV